MAHYTIKELTHYQGNEPDLKTTTFLFGEFYDPPVDDNAEDVRPEWAKEYVNAVRETYHQLDFLIGEKYGDYALVSDADDIEHAYALFRNWAVIYTITHRTELDLVYKAFRTDFNPLENYDRYELTKDNGSTSTGATSKTAPDDAETFFNMSNAQSSSTTGNSRDSHIHGNIGVTTTTALASESAAYFINHGFMDYFIERLIKDSCFIFA